MAIYLKKFETTSQYNAYTADTANFILPNVSLITETNTVEYNPFVPETMVVAKFNVTNTSSPTQIIYWEADSPFSAIEIDGVVQPSVVKSYTFDTTGEHIVKYTLTDPTSIGDSAFNGCDSLTSIDIPNSVTSIGNSAFAQCTSLTSIEIPDGVTSIDGGAFYQCSGLTSIDIPSGVTSIGNGAFDNTPWWNTYSADTSHHYGNIIYINDVAYKATSASITSATFKSETVSIAGSAFQGCRGLTSITIPNSVTSINGGAFQSCTSLTSIVSNATTAPRIQSNTFYNVNTGGTLTVPIGSSGYDVWMSTGNFYLGKYGWTKVEQ